MSYQQPSKSFTPSKKSLSRPQNTLKKEVSLQGIGVHTGQDVAMWFRPAKEGTGLVFRRVDLPSAPEVPATIEYVQETSRSTILGIGDLRIKTVEHVLGALKAYQIDNLYIDLTAEEPPVANGSADVFVEMIEEAEIFQQQEQKTIMTLDAPVYLSEGEVHMVALPSDEYRISYTLSYPKSSFLRAQYYSFALEEEEFKKQIAPCRTFSLYEEVSPLMDKGLIKGGSLSNAVIIKDDVVFSKEGLFFPDEMVRHKILDVIGDLSLVGFDFLAHVITIRSGHRANVAFAKKIYQQLTLGASYHD